MCSDTITAAWIQGLCTFLAGCLALRAGKLAYKAATRETRRHEQQDINRRIAFAQHMTLVIEDLKLFKETNNFSSFALEFIISENLKTIKKSMNIKWNDFSLLAEDIRRDIFYLRKNIVINPGITVCKENTKEYEQIMEILNRITHRLEEYIKDLERQLIAE